MELPEACLFDLDGLLLDTEPLHGQAWSQTAANFGGKLTEHQLFLLRGRRRNDCAKQIIQWLEKPIKTSDLLSVHQPIARVLLGKAKAMPCAENLVRFCFENEIPMALVTSSTSESVAFKSAPHEWLKLIKTKVLGDDPYLFSGKPAPDPFLLAAKKLNANPKKCWVLEDSEAGTKSGLAAGCQVWVLKNVDRDYFSIKNEIELFNPQNISSLKIVIKQLQIALNN